VSRNRLAGILTLAAFLIGSAVALALSVDPDYYFSYRPRETSKFEYPWRNVAFTLGLMLSYTVAVYLAFIKLRWAVWIRSVAALLIVGAWGLYISRFVVHTPGFWMIHLLYLWIAIVTLGGACLALSIRAAWSYARKGKKGYA
jgi:hypothetical protein